MNSIYNNEISKDIFSFSSPKFTKYEANEILSNLFEQLLIFDNVILSTNNHNTTLKFLINQLGLETVERLLRSKYIKLSIRSSVIMGASGTLKEDGSIDESTIIGKPPITSASLSGDDINPEVNLYRALKNYDLSPKNLRRLIKLGRDNYIESDNLQLGTNAADFITNSYINNHLDSLGLPFSKDPNDLNMKERRKLIELGSSVLNMGIISKNGYKTMDRYEELQIALKSQQNIGKAYKIKENTTEIFKIENTPDLKSIYLNNNFDIHDIFKLRHLNSAKHFRKWINTVGENINSNEVTEAYINEISSTTKYLNKLKGKLLKNTLIFGVSTLAGSLITDKISNALVAGKIISPLIEPTVDYGIGLIEELTIDGILKGNTSKAYISNLKEEISEREKKDSL